MRNETKQKRKCEKPNSTKKNKEKRRQRKFYFVVKGLLANDGY